MVNNLKDIISHSMAFIEDDYTELWVVASKILEENPKLTFNELIKATKEVVQELVKKNNVLLLDEQTQKPMKLNIEDILKIVEQRFKTLGRIPTVGDGIWFTIEQ